MAAGFYEKELDYWERRWREKENELFAARRWSAAWKAAAKKHRRGYSRLLPWYSREYSRIWASVTRFLAQRDELYRENQELKETILEINEDNSACADEVVRLDRENQELKKREPRLFSDRNHELIRKKLERENQELKQRLADIQEEFARYACRVEGIATGESAEQFIKRFIDWSEDFLQAEDFDLMDLVHKLTDFQEAGEIVLGLREEPPPKERPKDVVVGTSYHSVVNSQPNTWQKDDGPDITELSAGDIL